ncbi:hypothetical protein SH591_07080 [Sphingomonas sp. LY54]|uniref:hypothetical protein n=1 Tax=Sphingomonas sp. LY54 TaxID=3095343 RepID=UPI002D78A771|nr:hypothetical protein [Sphingomonas sp. LY54]WRP29933.1 hypothetical protein SH591_07080 [Sphingomonas sp. LY54]
MRRRCLVLAAALALAGCSGAEEPRAAPGAVEAHLAKADKRVEADRAVAVREARAREKARAEAATARIDASEEARAGR